MLSKTVLLISHGREGRDRPWVVLVSRRQPAPAAAEMGAAEAGAEPDAAITVEPGNGAVSHATWISLAAACCSGLLLYSVKHRTTVMDAQIGRAFHAIKAAHDTTAILKVEWAALNEPTRLQSMASQYLTLTATVPSQFVALGDLPARLPAPGTIIPGPMPPVIPLHPAPPPADPALARGSVPVTPEVVANATPPAPAQAAADPAPAPSTAPVTTVATGPAAPPAAMPADPAPSPGTAPVLLAAAPATEAAPAAEPPPAQPAPQPGAPVVAASPPPAQVAATHAATPDMMSSSVGWNPAEPPAPRAARPAPRVASRPVMIAHLHAPAITVPPLNHLPIAAIAPPRIRLPALAAFHGKPDPAHGHVGPAPLLHLAMARQPARHDVTLAEFMAQIDVAKPASHRSAPPHHAGQGRSDPPHNLSLPPPAPETLVARSEPPHQAEAPAASPDRAPPAQRQEQAAVEQPRYQPPAYRYPPYQMPYGSPYSPVYRSPWGPYAWSSRPYYPQQPQPGYAYQ